MIHSPGGLAPASIAQLLFQLPAANMAVTTDQTFVKSFTGNLWVPLFIGCAQASGAFNTACAGGIYTVVAKGGTAIVAAGQSYAALTGPNTGVNAAIATAVPQTATPILSLTTGNGAALTGNFFIFGVVIG